MPENEVTQLLSLTKGDVLKVIDLLEKQLNTLYQRAQALMSLAGVIFSALFFVLLAAITATYAQKSTLDQPTSAYIQSLAIDPQDPQRLYAAAMSDGLFISDDGGESWRSLPALSRLKSVQVIEIDPRQSNRLFAGGEKSGVWLSMDRGLTWQCIGLDSLTICDIALHPQNPDHLLVLAADGVYRCKQIRRSPWEKVFDYIAFQQKIPVESRHPNAWEYTRFQKIEIDPHQPKTILLGARWEGGYHRSDDGGDSWQHLSLGGLFRRVDPILFHSQDPNIIMVGTHHQGFFKSYNRGISWVSMSIGMEPQRRTPYYGAYLISGLALAPSNDNTLYTGSDQSNWKSVDGGLSWQEMGKTLTCPFARAYAVHPKDERIVYAGTNVGIYKSIDGGQTWEFSSKGFPTVTIDHTVDLSLRDGPYQFALSYQKPLLFRRSLNPLDSWLPVNWLLPEPGLLLEKGNGVDEVRLVSETQTYSSWDGGLRWQDRDPQFVDVSSPIEEQPFKGDAKDQNLWTVEIELNGKAFFDDRWLGTLYRRPPYIALYLVSTDYPCDYSKPYWQTTIDRALHFTVQIPRAHLPKKESMFYCEVRDFQRNTLIGVASVQPGVEQRVDINLSPQNRLPALQKQLDSFQRTKRSE